MRLGHKMLVTLPKYRGSFETSMHFVLGSALWLLLQSPGFRRIDLHSYRRFTITCISTSAAA